MAAGSGLGSLIPLVVTLAGIITILKARRRRKAGRAEEADDGGHEARVSSAREMERRMASYLAERDAARHAGGGSSAPMDQTGRETDR